MSASNHRDGECGDVRELLDEYALGSLGHDAHEHVRGHLLACSGCSAEAQAIVETLSMIGEQGPRERPRQGAWERLSARIRAGQPEDEGQHAGTIFELEVRAAALRLAESMEWSSTPFEGVRAKVLAHADDPSCWTVLVQMDPETDFPAHHHHGTERLLLLDGDLEFSDRTMARGDRTHMAAGSDHGAARTTGGCRLLYEGCPKDWSSGPAGPGEISEIE